MTNNRKTSRILGATIVLASATLLLAGSANAAVKVNSLQSGQTTTESRSLGDTTIRVSANSRRTTRSSGAQQQTTSTSNAGATLSSGGGQQPQLGTAGEEMKKILKKLPKPHCGNPHSIC